MSKEEQDAQLATMTPEQQDVPEQQERAKASSEAPATGADKADAVGARRGSLQSDMTD